MRGPRAPRLDVLRGGCSRARTSHDPDRFKRLAVSFRCHFSPTSPPFSLGGGSLCLALPAGAFQFTSPHPRWRVLQEAFCKLPL